MHFDEVLHYLDNLGYTVIDVYDPYQIVYYYFCDQCYGWENYPSEEKPCCLSKNQKDSIGYVTYLDKNGNYQFIVIIR